MTSAIVENSTAALTAATALALGLCAACGAADNDAGVEALAFDTQNAAISRCAPNVDPSIAVPAGNKVGFRLGATGSQVYVCQASGSGTAWALQAPDAVLLDGKRVVGTHYAGPTWQFQDASLVVGSRLSGFTPDPNAIPWLLLQATSHAGAGKMAPVTYIQRVNTVAGLAPSAASCTATNVGSVVPVEYSATYYFFVAGNQDANCIY